MDGYDFYTHNKLKVLLGRLRGISLNPLNPHMMLSSLQIHVVFSGRKSIKSGADSKSWKKQI